MKSGTLNKSGRLSKKALAWSLDSILDHGLNSLYQRPFEFEIFQAHKGALIDDLCELRVDFYRWSEPRRMVVPKDRYSFRLATQLDPIDALVLTAIVKMIGRRIEARRLPPGIVFSHRFAERSESLYQKRVGWPSFWRESKARSQAAKFVVQTDISDFYGQISHREIVTQLQLCEIPERLCIALEGFLSAFGGEQGRGVPVGPHAVHLLAEMSLIRADRLMEASGHSFIRYIDDYHLFCESEEDSALALYDVASIIRGEFNLALNSGKTKVVPAAVVVKAAKAIIREEAPRAREESFLKLLEKLGKEGEFYEDIDLDEAVKLDSEAISEEAIREILSMHLLADRVDYKHLGWLLRRFAQVGAPGGVPFVLEHFDKLSPVIGDVAQYISAAGRHWDRGLLNLGESVLDHAQRAIVKQSPYLEMVLYGLFGRDKEFNHFGELARRFQTLSGEAKREVILAARKVGSSDWLHAMRKKAHSFDPWMRRAFVYAIENLPSKQKEECLEALDTEERSTDTVVLGALLAERSTIDVELWREPSGPAWAATRLMVAKSRRRLVAKRMEVLGERLETNVYGNAGEASLLVATWNLRNFGGGAFGFGERLAESLMFIARVLLGFDLVALQEVRSTENVNQLMALLGTGWSKVICGEAPGRSGNREMCAFLYRHRRLEFLGEVEQVVLPRSALIQGVHQFARPPFIAAFKTQVGGKRRASPSTITACTAHVYFGASRGEKYDRRVKEIEALVQRLLSRVRSDRSTALLLGDLNVVDPDDLTMAPLARADMSLAESYLSPTNSARDRFYTQIAFRPTQDGPRLSQTGVVELFDLVYRDKDHEKYLQEMHTSQAWDSGVRRGSQTDNQTFFRKWRTYQMSDHLPLWADFQI